MSADRLPEASSFNTSAAPLRYAFLATIRRDLTLKLRRRSELANPLVFFALIITLFPLGITPRQEVLRELAPGLLWVSALLAVLLSLDGLFRDDFEDGTLEQLLLSPQPSSLLVLAKITAHWLTTGLPLAFMAPLLGLMLALPATSFPALCATLALGSASLSLIGAIGAALTVGLKRGGVLLSLLILPLYIPVLIFGAGAVKLAIDGAVVMPYLALLGALLAAGLALAPWAATAALRLSVNG
ncbi:heme exporter protein CcmB [Phytohalomonas tamaricis]|uniref:heme exporter protein CcmB n=1 Tax=Phytohalomonas tamaricis TaxID=2081032 RepID=UPI0021D47F6F|nr:heme exporter protein CcmB [Phytohalomonas tamaricis]